MLPQEYPKWQTVYYYFNQWKYRFNQWKYRGIFEAIKQALVRKVRIEQDRNEQPSIAIIDAQSVKSTLVSSKKDTGYDGGKRIKGIRRHLAVDALGLPLSEVVHSASIADRKGGAMVVEKLKASWTEIKKLFADGGYSLVGKAKQSLQKLAGYDLEIVHRSELPGFHVRPKRWVVERTFSWIETNRRNARYFERLTNTAEAMVKLSAIRMMLNRVCPRNDKPVFIKKVVN